MLSVEHHDLSYIDTSLTPSQYMDGHRVQDTFTLKGPNTTCNGASCSSTYTYDARERLIQEAKVRPGVPPSTVRYDLDYSGNIRTINTNGMDTPLVDTHCHTFNGDDLPVRGFISHVRPSSPLGGVLARFLDGVLQAGAPGNEAARSRLDALLAEEQSAETLGVAAIAPDPALTTDPRGDLAAEPDRALRDLSGRRQPYGSMSTRL
jgi:hypothetical protein